MPNLFPLLQLGFLNPRNGLLYRMHKKLDSWHSLASSLSNKFLGSSGLWRNDIVYESTCNHDLPCNGTDRFFEERIVRSADAALISLNAEQTYIHSALQTFSKSSATSVRSSTQTSLGWLFCSQIKKCSNTFCGILCLLSFFIYASTEQALTN